MSVYQLCYHEGLGGRSIGIQLLLLDAGIKYDMIPVVQGGRDRVLGENGGFPVFAPPALVSGDFTLGQSPAICYYLGQKHGYVPNNPEVAAHCMQIILDSADIFSESAKARNELDRGSKYVAAGGRLSQWMEHLNKIFNFYSGNFICGENISAADFMLLQAFIVNDYLFGAHNIASITPDSLKQWKSAMFSRPSLAAYIALGDNILFPSMKYIDTKL